MSISPGARPCLPKDGAAIVSPLTGSGTWELGLTGAPGPWLHQSLDGQSGAKAMGGQGVIPGPMIGTPENQEVLIPPHTRLESLGKHALTSWVRG